MKRLFSNDSSGLFKNAKFEAGMTSSITGRRPIVPTVREYFPDHLSSISADDLEINDTAMDEESLEEDPSLHRVHEDTLHGDAALESDAEITGLNVDEKQDSKIYESSEVTVDEFCLILVAYQRKHRLSDAAMDDFCKLVGRLVPSPNCCPRSWKILKRIVDTHAKTKVGNICSSIQKVCSICGLAMDNCTCSNCTATSQRMSAYFTCNVMQQLLIMLSCYGEEIIRYLKDAAAIRADGRFVTDIITGQLYSERYSANPDGNNLFLNLLLNADGAKFTSSKFGSFWPVLAELVELPKKLRRKFENVLLLALWQGETKPNWELLLRNCVDELIGLLTVGFSTTISGVLYHIQVNVIATVLDAPARASFWNVTQFNGEFGCMNCLQKGDYQNHRRLWPYQEVLELKTTEWYKRVFEQLRCDSTTPPIYGVKGLSMMDKLCLDPCSQNPIDFMHQTYEGTFGKVLNAVFSSGCPWSLGRGKVMKQIDRSISKICFPVDYQRRIPSLDDMKSFKASELKNLLFYGLIPCAMAHLNSLAKAQSEAADFLHWILLYHEICASLNVDQIQIDQFDFLEKMIAVWLQLLPTFLGDEGETFNAHCTRHLPYYARLLGPLHNFSTFSFESFNGILSKLVTSANGPINQVARRFFHEKYLRSVSSKSASPSILSTDKKSFLSKSPNVFEDVKIFGDPKYIELDDDEYECLAFTFPSLKREDILTASEAKVGSLLVRGRLTEGDGKACTHAAKFLENGRHFYAIINRLIVVGESIFAVCREINILRRLVEDFAKPCHALLQSLVSDNGNISYGNFFYVGDDKSLYRLISLNCLQCRCILVRNGTLLIIIEEIMQFEHN